MTSESRLVSDTALNTLKSIENSNKQINLYGKLNILLDLKLHISEKINEIQKEIVNSGDFMGDEIIERDHFQITKSYEENK